MKPNGGGTKLPGALQKAVDSDLGGYDKMRADFINAGTTQFGSGWAWLAVKDGKLAVMKTANGENPLMHGAHPILGCDVWEHSYYIDYRNARPKYLEAFVRQPGELGIRGTDVRRSNQVSAARNIKSLRRGPLRPRFRMPDRKADKCFVPRAVPEAMTIEFAERLSDDLAAHRCVPANHTANQTRCPAHWRGRPETF